MVEPPLAVTAIDLLASPFGFNVTTFLDDMIRLSLAIFLGGIVGAERQLAGQSAGLRTHVMVALGSAVFTLAGIATAGGDLQQVTRVVQGVAAGVGFLGAGAILRINGDTKVRGLTTAGSIWVAAAMGTAAGLGEYALAAAVTVASLVVMVVLKPVSHRLNEYVRRRDQTE
jgi:putative Mg2+ transporter-C (MgtC) family protein